MFLTDKYSIKEVLAFPFLKEDITKGKEKLAAEEVGVEPMAEEGIRESSPMFLFDKFSLNTVVTTSLGVASIGTMVYLLIARIAHK
jgi:hypothetical protein